MKVLQVTNAYPSLKHPVHGIFIKEQLNSINEKGVDFDLLFINAKDFGKLEYLKAYFKLLKCRKQYDIIHCHHFLVGFLSLLTFPKAKVIVSFLSDGTNEFMLTKNIFSEYLIKWMYSLILKRSDGRIFKKAIPDSLITDEFSFYLPNGVNLDLFKHISKKESKIQLGLDVNKRYILFCSLNNLYRPEKRYDIFKNALDTIKSNKSFSDVEELVLINESRDRVPYYFNAAEVYVLTSDFEGSPNAVKECVSTGTPVISRNVGDVQRTIGNLEGCEILSSEDPTDYVTAISKLLNSKYPEIRSLYKRRIMELQLDVGSVADNLIAIYSKVLS
ncbi:glycosyltransferase [Marivirga sp. S37H4]|uniref:Glycosyltransferase n=1 Tax=Marivirga aurantiaca TaxID=2802615 RepID=A0A934X166_9BACT|nr:glycosyltransferase [Marivirga aurantiaca]MBK6267063.1 glycosyltransferase [Marivirga aurantiaca]